MASIGEERAQVTSPVAQVSTVFRLADEASAISRKLDVVEEHLNEISQFMQTNPDSNPTVLEVAAGIGNALKATDEACNLNTDPVDRKAALDIVDNELTTSINIIDVQLSYPNNGLSVEVTQMLQTTMDTFVDEEATIAAAAKVADEQSAEMQQPSSGICASMSETFDDEDEGKGRIYKLHKMPDR